MLQNELMQEASLQQEKAASRGTLGDSPEDEEGSERVEKNRHSGEGRRALEHSTDQRMRESGETPLTCPLASPPCLWSSRARPCSTCWLVPASFSAGSSACHSPLPGPSLPAYSQTVFGTTNGCGPQHTIDLKERIHRVSYPLLSCHR